jgi:hypothetical protein
MDEIDFNTFMTKEQVELCEEASGLMRMHMSKQRLEEGLKIGVALLHGRRACMEATGVKKPNGAVYNRAFAEWKHKFGFDTLGTNEAVPPTYLKDCLVCAAERDIAENIISSLDPKQRANMGPSGLAARIRKELKVDKEVDPDAPPKKTMAEQVKELESKNSELLSENHRLSTGQPIDWRASVKVIADQLIVDDEPKAKSLYKALKTYFELPPKAKTNKRNAAVVGVLDPEKTKRSYFRKKAAAPVAENDNPAADE